MIAEIKALSALLFGLAFTVGSRFLIRDIAKIHPLLFWPASIITTCLMVRKFAAGNPLPPEMLQANLSNKTIVITGCSAGLGYNSALFFAARGARVILGNRSVARNEETAKRLRAEPESQGKTLDLVTKFSYDAEDLGSVKKFALDLTESFNNSTNSSSSAARLDYLLLNAGMSDFLNVHWSKVHPEIEYTACINSFAPLLLTEVLMNQGVLKKSNTRVVVVASAAHRRISASSYTPAKVVEVYKSFWAQRKEDRTPSSQMLPTMTRYAFSKLFNIYHADYLASNNIEVATLHPGVCSTNFVSKLGSALQFAFQYIGPYVGTKTEKEGAFTQIYCTLCQPAPPVVKINDAKNTVVSAKSSYFCDCRRSMNELTKFGNDTNIANDVIAFALEKIRGI